MQSVCVDWVKLGAYWSTAIAFWALSLIPTMPKPLQGLCSGGAVIAAALSANEARKAHEAYRWGAAHRLLDEQIQQNEMAYAAHAMDQLLMQRYESAWAPPLDEPEMASYSDNSELQARNRLETIYQGTSDDSKTTSYELPGPEFCRSIASLVETQGESYVIKDVLKMGGKNYQVGKERLQWILETGRQMKWI